MFIELDKITALEELELSYKFYRDVYRMGDNSVKEELTLVLKALRLGLQRMRREINEQS